MERTGLKAKIRLVVAIRFAFALLLFITFAINVFSLLMQIQEGKTLLEERRVYIKNVTYPSLTLCPISTDPLHDYHVSG